MKYRHICAVLNQHRSLKYFCKNQGLSRKRKVSNENLNDNNNTGNI